MFPKGGEMEIDNFEIDDMIEKLAMKYLSLLKISPSVNGYHYFKCGIKKIYYDSSKKFKVSKVLYPEIAKEFNIEESLVDRSMRHAMKMSFKRGGVETLEKHINFKFPSAIPTPREILCVLSDIVKKELRKSLMETTKKSTPTQQYPKNTIAL